MTRDSCSASYVLDSARGKVKVRHIICTLYNCPWVNSANKNKTTFFSVPVTFQFQETKAKRYQLCFITSNYVTTTVSRDTGL